MSQPPLISGHELLASYASDHPPHVVDCRHRLDAPEAGEADYLAGHLPGAVHAHLERDLSAPRGPGSGRNPLPDREQAAQQLGHLGIGPDTPVVAYDDVGGAMAARLWWMLHWVGHTRVRVLDGGLRAWLTAGGTLEPGRVTATPTALPLRTAQVSVCSQEEIRRWLQAPLDAPMHLIDVRSAERLQGQQEPLDPVAGHVPGAHNLPHALSLDADAHFRQPDELRALFSGQLPDTDPSGVVVMCGSGVSACHTLLAMRQAGLEGPRLYPGSWSEWIQDPENPIATGE